MRYVQRYDDEPFTVALGVPTRWACCDCKLIHDMLFELKDGELVVTTTRNMRSTAARRRKKP